MKIIEVEVHYDEDGDPGAYHIHLTRCGRKVLEALFSRIPWDLISTECDEIEDEEAFEREE